MRTIWVVLAIALGTSSCRLALFDSVPGQVQTSFPESMQGKYTVKVSSGWFRKQTNDTLYFDIREQAYIVSDSSEQLITRLDETHKLARVNQKYYILASSDDQYSQFWTYAYLEPTKKGLKLYSFLEDQKGASLRKYFGRKFVELNGSGDSVFVYRNTDPQLGKYIDKVVRKQDALELIRIQK